MGTTMPPLCASQRFGRAMGELRRKQGWNYREMAQRCGIAHSRLWKLESQAELGQRVNLTLETGEVIAGCLGVDLSDMLGPQWDYPEPA